MANTTQAGIPLTRHGTRVPTIAPRANAKTPATATATVTAPATVDPPRPVAPTPTIRTMIVCVPDELPTQVLNSTRQLDRHLGVQATSYARFWASPTVGWWYRPQMIDLRKAKAGPRYCAGGPVRLLDLAGMRHGAAVGAGIRHQYWTAVVSGTRNATPWQTFLLRHLADPGKYPMATAQAEFEAQPRVLAMRMHNASAIGSVELDPYELEILQAGQAAYAHYHSMWSVCTDAVLTADGTLLQPASDAATHKVGYLSQAIRYVDNLDRDQRLLAVTL